MIVIIHAQTLSKLRKCWHKAADDATLLSENAVPSQNVGQVKREKYMSIAWSENDMLFWTSPG